MSGVSGDALTLNQRIIQLFPWAYRPGRSTQPESFVLTTFSNLFGVPIAPQDRFAITSWGGLLDVYKTAVLPALEDQELLASSFPHSNRGACQSSLTEARLLDFREAEFDQIQLPLYIKSSYSCSHAVFAAFIRWGGKSYYFQANRGAGALKEKIMIYEVGKPGKITLALCQNLMMARLPFKSIQMPMPDQAKLLRCLALKSPVNIRPEKPPQKHLNCMNIAIKSAWALNVVFAIRTPEESNFTALFLQATFRLKSVRKDSLNHWLIGLKELVEVLKAHPDRLWPVMRLLEGVCEKMKAHGKSIEAYRRTSVDTVLLTLQQLGPHFVDGLSDILKRQHCPILARLSSQEIWTHPELHALFGKTQFDNEMKRAVAGPVPTHVIASTKQTMPQLLFALMIGRRKGTMTLDDAVQRCLDFGVDPRQAGSSMLMRLLCARKNIWPELTRALIQRPGQLDLTNKSGHSALSVAIQYSDPEYVDAIISQRKKSGLVALLMLSRAQQSDFTLAVLKGFRAQINDALSKLKERPLPELQHFMLKVIAEFRNSFSSTDFPHETLELFFDQLSVDSLNIGHAHKVMDVTMKAIKMQRTNALNILLPWLFKNEEFFVRHEISLAALWHAAAAKSNVGFCHQLQAKIPLMNIPMKHLKSRDGELPHHIAAECGNDGVLAELLSLIPGFSDSILNCWGESLLFLAMGSGDLSCVLLVLKRLDAASFSATIHGETTIDHVHKFREMYQCNADARLRIDQAFQEVIRQTPELSDQVLKLYTEISETEQGVLASNVFRVDDLTNIAVALSGIRCALAINSDDILLRVVACQGGALFIYSPTKNWLIYLVNEMPVIRLFQLVLRSYPSDLLRSHAEEALGKLLGHPRHDPFREALNDALRNLSGDEVRSSKRHRSDLPRNALLIVDPVDAPQELNVGTPSASV